MKTRIGMTKVVKTIRKYVGIEKTKQIVKVARKAKHANTVYDGVTAPITLVDVANIDFPQYVPYHKAVSQIITTHPYVQSIYDVYDHFSNAKDVCERSVTVVTKSGSIRQIKCAKKRAVFAVKCYLLLYKLSWIVLAYIGISKSGFHFTVILDNLNIILGFI